jgi:trimethylamine:corrinoid methyltransferase-like protein
MSKYIVDCSDGGDKEVTLTVGDVANHYDTCTTTVFVKDNILPEAVCIADFDIHLDELGQATISPTDIDDRSSDNCMNYLQLQVSPRHFTCDNVGGKRLTYLSQIAAAIVRSVQQLRQSGTIFLLVLCASLTPFSLMTMVQPPLTLMTLMEDQLITVTLTV